eukprot:tig00000093_g3658.t1
MPSDASTGSARLRLYVDYDDTLTDGDTTGLLVQCAARKLADADAKDLLERWHALEGEYFPKYRRAVDVSLRAVEELPAPGTGPEPLEALEQFFGPEFDALEEWSLDVLKREGFLRGLAREDLRREGARSVRLREGAADLLKLAAARGAVTRVVSVNWSQDLIRGTLEAAGIPTRDGFRPEHAGRDAPSPGGGAAAWAERLDPAPAPAPLPVFACDLEYSEGGAGASTGRVVRRITSARHKRDIIRALAAHEAAAGAVAAAGPSVYVGDSINDLLAMLEVDVGIVVGESSSIGRLCHTLRVPILPLPAEPGPASRAASGRVLYRAASWADIARFLFSAPAPSSSPSPAPAER